LRPSSDSVCVAAAAGQGEGRCWGWRGFMGWGQVTGL
jgi:hypothetical protein